MAPSVAFQTAWIVVFFGLVVLALLVMLVLAPRGGQSSQQLGNAQGGVSGSGAGAPSSGGEGGGGPVIGGGTPTVPAGDLLGFSGEWVQVAHENDHGTHDHYGVLKGAYTALRIDAQGSKQMVMLLIQERTGYCAVYVSVDHEVVLHGAVGSAAA